MKKTLFTLSCALFAAVGLTCCGGGGGGNSFSGRTFVLFAPETIEGHMDVTVADPRQGTNMYEATVCFGGKTYNGNLTVSDSSDEMNPKIRIQLFGGQSVGTDEGFKAYFAKFLPEEFDENAQFFGMPGPEITLHYDSNKMSGTYDMVFKFPNLIDEDTGDPVPDAIFEDCDFYVK